MLSIPVDHPVRVTLERTYSSDAGTFGKLMLGDEMLCYTLERLWQGNKSNESCIPEGVYKCIPHNGEHFKQVWEVTGVKDRKAILIHAGNTLKDTHGCILVGLSLVENGVTQSQLAIKKLRHFLPSNFVLEVITKGENHGTDKEPFNV